MRTMQTVRICFFATVVAALTLAARAGESSDGWRARRRETDRATDREAAPARDAVLTRDREIVQTSQRETLPLRGPRIIEPAAIPLETKDESAISTATIMRTSCSSGSCGSGGCSTCAPCDRAELRIGRLISELECSRHAWTRKCAAEKLACYNWRHHPEIVAALLEAMQSDCDWCVRTRAAASLKCMKACDPDVIAAMDYSRGADSCFWVRWTACCGAKKLERKQPPIVSFVSGYGHAECDSSAQTDEGGNGPSLAPVQRRPGMPTPEPKPKRKNDEFEETSSSGVRDFLSSAANKLRSRS